MLPGFISRLALTMTLSVAAFAADTPATIVYDDLATKVNVSEESGQLWTTTAGLKRASGFELKPQGVCRAEMCFPVPKARQQEFVRKEPGGTWFNLTAFAQLVHQPVAHDQGLATWYFGLRSDQRQGLASLRAPDFTLPDIDGKMHSLSDFRGKKVFLVTWASW